MMIATIITTGDTQMICLPKEIHFENTQLYVYLEGEQVILSPHPKDWKDFFENPQRPTEDFMADRVDLLVQERDYF